MFLGRLIGGGGPVALLEGDGPPAGHSAHYSIAFYARRNETRTELQF